MAMTINCINEMNLYFHMQNHYKKLRSAKSQIDNFSQNSQNLLSSRSEKLLRSYHCNQRHEKVCPILKQKKKNKNSSKSKSEPCVIACSLPEKLEKNQNSEIPVQLQFMQKEGNKHKKNQKVQTSEGSEIKETQVLINGGNDCNKSINKSIDDQENMDNSYTTAGLLKNQKLEVVDCLTEKLNVTEKANNSRAEEHEYLQFLLRITEDIIINNYCKSEDIENVFEYHIEMNKERLDMGKMMDQIASLSSALNISCDKFEIPCEIPEKYVFELANDSIDYSTLKDCECAVERHLLHKEQVNGCTPALKTFYGNSDDNLSQITNSFNSIQLVHEDLKYSSDKEISQSGYIEVSDSSDIKQYYKRDNDFISSKEELKEIVSEGLLVAPKLQIEISNHLIVESAHEIFIDSTIEEVESEKIPENSIEYFEKTLKSQETVQNNSHSSNLKKLGQIERQLTFVKEYKNDNHSSEKPQSNEIVPVLLSSEKVNSKDITDKSTQILIEQKDEECNTTTDNLKEINLDSGYVLINGPLYILKEALSPERRIVLSEEKHMDIDIAPVKEVTNINSDILEANLNLSDYSIVTPTDSSSNYLNDLTFSRLLHSDYDLTPQKEESLNKYHYLMVDAYTSISDVSMRGQQSNENFLNGSEGQKSTTFDKVNPHLLAKSEDYLLNTSDFSAESSMLEKNSSENSVVYTERIQNCRNIPSDRKRNGDRIFSAPPNLLDMYRIKENKSNNSSTELRNVIHLRKHRSLQ